VGVAAGLTDRKRPFSLLRLAGAPRQPGTSEDVIRVGVCSEDGQSEALPIPDELKEFLRAVSSLLVFVRGVGRGGSTDVLPRRKGEP
jgi:hypothetical protein